MGRDEHRGKGRFVPQLDWLEAKAWQYGAAALALREAPSGQIPLQIASQHLERAIAAERRKLGLLTLSSAPPQDPRFLGQISPFGDDVVALAAPQRLGAIAQPWVKSVEAAFGATYAELPVAIDEDLAAAGKTAYAHGGARIGVASAEVIADPAVMVHEVAHIAQQRSGLTLGEGGEMEGGQGQGAEPALSPTRAVAPEEEVEAEGAGDAGGPMAARAQGEVDPNENAAEEQDAAGGQPDLEAEAEAAAAALLGGGIAAEGLVLSPAAQERLYSDLEPAAEGLRSGAAMGASGLPEPLPASERFRRHLEAALQKDLEDYLKKIDTQANEAMAQINAAIAEAKSGPLWANPLTAAKRMSELEALRNGAQKRQAKAIVAVHLSRFVVRELRGFLRCGIRAHGFVRVRCPKCRHEFGVA